MASSFDRLKELDLSRDEVNRLGEALRNEEFRKLLGDYVDEIQDPKNRQIYEEEVKNLEKERGQEVTFLHPTPGYVIKTSVNGSGKGFINICSNTNIAKPSSSPTVKDGTKGLQWSLPHSLSPPHEDVDNRGARCQVYDVLFHPNTLHLASKNGDFRSMVNNVALEAVEHSFNVTLDKKNLKHPKMSFKGLQRASILRRPTSEKPTEKTPEEQALFDKIYSEIDSQRPKKTSTKSRSRRNSHENPIYTTPKYVIKHSTHIDMQDFTEHKNAKLNAAIPKQLIVEINLPLLRASSDMELDVTEKTVHLVSEKPAKYKLNLTLPYQVSETSGTAKFDKDQKKLVITLPVQRTAFEPTRDDSGVESCVESDLNSPTSFESDEEEPSVKPSEKTDASSDKTVKTQAVDDDFLNSSDLYNLPEFTCNVFDSTVAFTFNVKNVDEATVCKQTIYEKSIVKVKFTNVSSSFYPTSYAFYVQFPQHEIKEDGTTIETWDNNVILQIPLKASESKLISYLYGMDEAKLSKKFIEEPIIISTIHEHPELQEKPPTENHAVKENFPKKEKPPQNPQLLKSTSAIDILTSYESSGDELSASSFSPRKSKGILKRLSGSRSKFGRSVSESSLDDFICSSFENYQGSIECVPEDSREEDEMSSSFKKTVRFNDVVVKQLFRSNSSILGQKKKNQRKARNKKRSHDRRNSESESSDVEIKKEGDEQTIGSRGGNPELRPPGSDSDKKEYGGIFHLEMNN
ncbi:protein kintoun [Dendroctonus ponderosae]